ncbi:MAG: sulfotransferase [Proteobacteria bacterium]|nr:sulfotransferase [Pseudomonadota bacterium]
MIRITGQTGWPGWPYVGRKVVKYTRILPRTWIRAKVRRLTGFTPELNEHTFLFICGLHRSGTSLIHRLIRAHPQVSGIYGTTVPEDEGQHLQSVYPSDRQFGMLFALNPNVHLTEQSALVSDMARTRLLQDWGRYLDFRRPVLVEKSPSNIVRSRFLQALFPEARFLFIVRHPIVVTLAIQKWTDAPLRQLLFHWCVAHQLMLEDLPHLHHALVIRYEDLAVTPEKILSSAFDFVDLPAIAVSELIRNRNDRYFAAWRKMLAEDGDCTADLAERFGPLLMRFGYQLESPYVLRSPKP